jgi:hypothetical protein
MKNKKIILGLGSIFLGLALIFSVGSFVKADNENNHGDNNENEQKTQVHNVGSTLEVHIFDDGKVLVRGAKVTGVSGNTISAITAWNNANLNWTVNTDGSVQVLRRFGGMASISEIANGDFVSFSGTLSAGPTFTVNANVVKDWSIQKAHATFVGTVSSINVGAQNFVLASEDRGSVTVQVNSMTKIMKGDSTMAFADIVVGGKVSAGGLYDNQNHIVTADMVKIYLPAIVRTTIEGKVTSIAGIIAPTNFMLHSGDKDYKVNVGVDTSILNTDWLRTTLAKFAIGNTVRVYGTVHADNTVDATVVRDTSVLL